MEAEEESRSYEVLIGRWRGRDDKESLNGVGLVGWTLASTYVLHLSSVLCPGISDVAEQSRQLPSGVAE